MTLSSRHRIRNSIPGGLRSSTLPLGHGGSPQYWLSHVDGEETFLFLSTAESGNRTPKSGVKGSGANNYPRAPAPLRNKADHMQLPSEHKTFVWNLYNVGSTSRQRRWADVVQMLYKCFVFAGVLFGLPVIFKNICYLIEIRLFRCRCNLCRAFSMQWNTRLHKSRSSRSELEFDLSNFV